jgi:hypothetical protein
LRPFFLVTPTKVGSSFEPLPKKLDSGFRLTMNERGQMRGLIPESSPGAKGPRMTFDKFMRGVFSC